MPVLHAHWCAFAGDAPSDSLLFWAETGAIRKPRSEPARRLDAAAHPFAASTAALLKLLETAGASVDPARVRDRRVVLRLPGSAAAPEASPAHRLERDVDRESVPDGLVGEGAAVASSLHLWTVDGAALAPVDALATLLRLPGPNTLPAGLVLGDDLRFWRAAAWLALELLARQQFLPGLASDPQGTGMLACWLPAFTRPEDRARRARLIDTMPAICRAGAERSTPTPEALLDGFLSALVDAACRSWLPDGATAADALPGGPAGTWLAALSKVDAVLRIPAEPLADLSRAHRAWLAGLEPPRGAGCRVALRLQAPEASDVDTAGWQLHFRLQADDAPELDAPAEAAWRSGDQPLDVFGRRFERPATTLAEGLAWAARLVPALRRALARRNPRKALLSASEAHAFMEEAAPILRAAGFGVEAPEWWDRPEARLGVRLRLEGVEPEPVAGRRALDAAARFAWQLTLGDRPLGDAELAALAEARGPLARVDGHWLRLDPYQLAAAQRILRTDRPWRRLAEALPYGLGAESAVDGLPLIAVEASGWLDQRLCRLRGELELPAIPAPPGLTARLRPYQLRGLAWLAFLRSAAGGGILADDMGLGKTLQMLALILHLRSERGGRPAAPVLLVAPTSVVSSWAHEAARWAPSLVLRTHQGPDRPRGAAFAAGLDGVDLVLTSYALLRHDRALFSPRAWEGLILDEAQQIKNPRSQQARIARALDADWRFAVTGTPIENRLAELWSIVDTVLPGHLGPARRFQREIALPIERHGDEAALRRLRRLSAPFILRRLKRDPEIAAELPPKQEVRVWCHLSPEQVLLYQAVVREALAEVDASVGLARRGRVLAMLTRLKQVCNHPAQYLGQIEAGAIDDAEAARSGKLPRLAEMLEELVGEGEAALVFTQYTAMGGLMRGWLRERIGREVLFLHGGQPAALRERIVRRFQDDAAGPPVLLLSLKAGGTGLTLTRASHVFHFDRWWNPAVEDQATDRAYRIGQSRPVTAHKFVCQGTLEARIDAMLEQKRALAERVVGGGEDWLTELSAAELRQLVALGAEALAS
ncbi:MAG: DEAD/DEAH box helicase [Caldilineae bacterium]|nr:DEAD/DEAH box helicase [Chloroflexota bacterium]MCB9176461.1 DEAD/DEAH box helicase [Caldilineae bacterium]